MVISKDDRLRIIACVFLQNFVIEQVFAGNIVILLRLIVLCEQECGGDLLEGRVHPGLLLAVRRMSGSLNKQDAAIVFHRCIDLLSPGVAVFCNCHCEAPRLAAAAKIPLAALDLIVVIIALDVREHLVGRRVLFVGKSQFIRIVFRFPIYKVDRVIAFVYLKEPFVIIDQPSVLVLVRCKGHRIPTGRVHVGDAGVRSQLLVVFDPFSVLLQVKILALDREIVGFAAHIVLFDQSVSGKPDNRHRVLYGDLACVICV